MATLRALVPIAIMPGKNPLGGHLDKTLSEAVSAFYRKHGVLPLIVLKARELRPGEALSWTAFLIVEAEGQFKTEGHHPLEALDIMPKPHAPIVVTSPEGGRGGMLIPPEPVSTMTSEKPGKRNPGLDGEILALGGKGLGARAIANALKSRGIEVSIRSISRRLATLQTKELPL